MEEGWRYRWGSAAEGATRQPERRDSIGRGIRTPLARMAKAKPTKHTAKELKAKADKALTNRGGGKEGKSDRTGAVKGGHAKYECPVCKVTAPDLKTMQAHHESKHTKLAWDVNSIKNLHDVTGSTSNANGAGKKNWMGKGPSTL